MKRFSKSKMRFWRLPVLRIGIIILLFTEVVYSRPVTDSDQNIALKLQNQMIWSGADDGKPSYTVFRKVFDLNDFDDASVSLFADSRYLLWLNGVEILRGPCRFDPVAPSFDTVDATPYLKKGKNVIVVMVLSHGSNGKTMNHHPGLTAGLEIKSHSQIVRNIVTDSSWKWNNHTRFLPPVQLWADMCDRIDARLDDGDWSLADYNDSDWFAAAPLSGHLWGTLTSRAIPYLTKNEMGWNAMNNKSLPVGLKSGQSYIIKCDEMIQGFPSIQFEAEEGVQIQFEFGYSGDSENVMDSYGSSCFYTARGGDQVYTPSDSYGFRYLKIKVLSGSIYSPYNVLVKQIKLTDRRYPYLETGSFHCNDPFFNELWKRSVLTTKLNCEDGYTDCALREKVEWMGDAALIQYPLSRIMFALNDQDGVPCSDNQLMKSMLRHIAQSQSDSGLFKAHHPSDRFDIHAYIEDYTCLWVQALRQVYEYTGDSGLVKELWTPLKKQMKWFENHRSPNGLVFGREFEFFDNPLAYSRCNGATLNAYAYKAFTDAAYLASITRDAGTATDYQNVADELANSFNKYLWIPSKGTYSSGIFNGKQLTPTTHAAMMALNRGIVPETLKQQVQKYLFTHYLSREGDNAHGGIIPVSFFDLNKPAHGIDSPYSAFWLLEELFNGKRESAALSFIHEKWNYITKDTIACTLTESFGGGDLCHNNGAIPAYFMLSKVLGVSEMVPIKSKMVTIKPMMGNLTEADGTVVTAHGPVQVKWMKHSTRWSFQIKLPHGTFAQVILPEHKSFKKLMINNKESKFKISKGFIVFRIDTEVTEGIYQ